MVRTHCFYYFGGVGLIPGQRAKILQAVFCVFDQTYNFVFYFLYFRWFDSYGIFKNLKLVLLTNLKIRSLGIKESALYFHMKMIKVRVYILNYF